MTQEQERVLSVFELAQGLKRTVESATEGRWVEGEVGRLQSPGSGHVYFTLKDEHRDASIDCVMYKREATRFAARLTEGSRVQLRGRASFYPPRGRLQWIAEVARAAGQGSLLEALEKLKQQLVKEGLTDPQRKRQLPDEPRVVGVITSRTGAAFADICAVAARRGRVRVLLSPAVVQGDTAPASIMRAFDLLEAAKPDVIIIGRGGGSAEDLMAFNNEAVVRRVAASKIPTVSAVGHEVDLSLTDLVADARAATPSQAAELVVADARERERALRRNCLLLSRAMRSRITEATLLLDRTESKLSDPRFLLAEGQQALDELRFRLQRRGHQTLTQSREKFEVQRRRLYARHPQAVLSRARAELRPMDQRLNAAIVRMLDHGRARLSESGRSLTALSPLSVLGRGYALATLSNGNAVRDASLLRPGDEVQVRVSRGAFLARVQKVESIVESHAAFDHETDP